MMLRYGARGCSPWPNDDGHQKREKLSMGDKGKKDKDKGAKQKQAKQVPAKGKPATDAGAKKK